MSDNTGDDSLHVPSLRIEGFRGIDSLTINSLGRVTLLAGRNGTGKTTVLDAVRVFANRGRLSTLTAVLDRSEEYAGRVVDGETGVTEMPDFEALFHGRQARTGTSFTIGPAVAPIHSWSSRSLRQMTCQKNGCQGWASWLSTHRYLGSLSANSKNLCLCSVETWMSDGAGSRHTAFQMMTGGRRL